MAKAKRTLDQAKVAELVESVWEHRDELQRLAKELPTLLAEAGAQMRSAGEVAQRASGALSGDVRTFAGHAADVLEQSKHQLRAVLKALEGAGNALRNLPFIGEMGKMMGENLGSIGEVADNLDVVGRKVRGLGDRLADVGADLDEMGASLLGTGLAFTRSSGKKSAGGASAPPPAKKKAPAKKAAAAKKAAPVKKTAPAKKVAPAKKAAAKKVTPAKKAPAKRGTGR